MRKLSQQLVSLGFLMCFCSISAYCQCVNGISTNPENPINDQFDGSGLNNVFLNNTYISNYTGTAVSGAFDSFSINGQAAWDYPNLFTVIDGVPQDLPMSAPYENPNLSSVNAGSYDHILIPFGHPDERDFHWEDGWELLYLNSGFYPDGQRVNVADANNIIPTAKPPNNARVPHIIIYNRYRGIVRVFFNVLTEIGQLSNISLKLSHEEYNLALGIGLTGMFRHLSPYDTPLDQSTTHNEVQSFNYDNNNNLIWYTIDFQVGYDPCACSEPSLLRMELFGVKSSDLSLSGRSVSIQEDLYDPATGEPTYDRDFLVNVSSGEGERPGSTIYKKMDGMFDNYVTDLGKYNEDLKDYEAWQNNIGIQIMNLGKGLVTSSSTPIVSSLLSDFLISKSGRIARDSTDVKKLIKDGTKGFLGYGYDMLSAGIFGREPDKPQKPSMPTASISEMAFSGKLLDSIPIDIPVMFTPGSWPNAYGGIPELNPWSYPAYNEVLGLFALLKTPEIEMTDYSVPYEEDCDGLECDPPVCSEGAFLVKSAHYYSENKRVVKIKLQDTLQYALNPALDFDEKLTDLYAMFKVTLKGGETIDGSDFMKRTLTDSSDFFFSHWFRPCQNTNVGCEQTFVFETSWIEARKLVNRVFSFDFKSSSEESVCYNASGSPNWEHYASAEQLSTEIERVELKLMADMYFKQPNYQGGENNTVQVFTYLLYDANNSEHLDAVTFLNDAGTSLSAPYIPNVLLFDTPETADASKDYITSQNSSGIATNAEFVEISSDLNSDNNQFWPDGIPYDILAVEHIHLKPGARIRPNIRLGIEDFGESSIKHVNEYYVGQYCQSAQYQANTASKALRERLKAQQEQAELEEMTPEVVANNKVALYPNPANGVIQLRSSDLSISQVDVYDIAGRLMLQRNYGADAGKQVQMDIQNLQSGVYIVQIHCGAQVHKEKLVVGL